jgi:iron complex transport system ATP-binding protein
MSEPLLECVSVACGYPDREVLTNISFSLEAGSVTALLGRNGSGKSTLIKTISRLLKPIAGSVRIAGRDASQLGYKELARLVAHTPQDETPAFEFTVREIVLMGRLPHSDGLFESEEDHRAAERAMEMADCVHLASRPIRKLSGGERQRVLIARSLAQEAKLLLLDEPTSHLDPGHQLAIAQLLRDLASQGYGILAAVHDLNWASVLAERAILLSEGTIGLQGAMSDVLRSSILEKAYSVSFERIVDPSQTLRVFPRS